MLGLQKYCPALCLVPIQTVCVRCCYERDPDIFGEFIQPFVVLDLIRVDVRLDFDIVVVLCQLVVQRMVMREFA